MVNVISVQLNMFLIKSIFKWVYVVILLVGLVIGLIIGWFIYAPKNEITKVITSQTILERVAQKGFLVTRSVLVNQKAETKIDQGSDWSNFWWGYEVSAEALMKADVGVDLAALEERDIVISSTEKTICVVYPQAEISSISLEGTIQVQTKTGLLKRILDNNTERDYNLALTQLKEQTSKAVISNNELLSQARNGADVALGFLLDSTGYKMVTACR